MNLDAVVTVYNDSGHMKRLYHAQGSGVSANDAKKRAWKKINVAFNKDYPDIDTKYKVRGFNVSRDITDRCLTKG